MYYKIWSEDKTHIWDYIAFNQLANGSFVKYEMKDDLTVDYIIYKSDKAIDERTFRKRGLVHTLLNKEDIKTYIDQGLKG